MQTMENDLQIINGMEIKLKKGWPNMLEFDRNPMVWCVGIIKLADCQTIKLSHDK